ncbi:GAF and ANTAR domain-containing protein [Streptomyces sp. NPDC001205]
MNREQELAEAFVSLSDTFADDVDPTVLLDRLTGHCVALAGADAAGVMVTTRHGTLRIMSVSNDATALIDLVALQSGEGPCPDAFRSGQAVEAAHLAQREGSWPHFVAAARAAGDTGAYAVPLRVHEQPIGAVNVLLSSGRPFASGSLALVQALADVTAVSLVSWSPDDGRRHDILSQVQTAVSAKATLEIAKGMLAEKHRLTPAAAQRLLVAHARHRRQRPIEIAKALVDRKLDPGALAAVAPSTEH